MTYERLREQILEAGIVGAGGAGFPTHFKVAKDMDYLIVNGAECEPLLYTDNQLLEAYGREIMDTLNQLLILCNIKEGVIAIKKKYEGLISTLREYTHRYPHISIKAVENVYPIGDEVTLIYECTGRVIPRGELPSSQKVVEINVETLFNIFNKLKYDKPVTHTYVTLGGEIQSPKVYKVPIGTKVRELLRLAKVDIPKESSILVGGPMMGSFEDLDTLITKTTKGILILPSNHILHKLKKNADIKTVKRAMSSCSQCRMCTDLCPRNRLGHKVEPHKVMNAFANGLLTHYQGIETALGCCGCNVCSFFACHHELAPSALMMAVKKELLAHGERGVKDLIPVPKDEKSPRIPSGRLVARLGLSRYDQKAYLEEEEITPKFVYISTRQHIGNVAECVVKKSDRVEIGSLIAKNSEEGISTNIHASINGEVVDIKDDLIIIESIKR
ncbi:MAG: 4Fe-4S dicluster domain-containing protein [Cellulosilyticaceae bacterium]